MTGEPDDDGVMRFQMRTLFLATAFVAVATSFAKHFYPGLRALPSPIVIAAVGGLFTAGFVLVVVGAFTLVKQPKSAWAQHIVKGGGILMACSFPLAVGAVICSEGMKILMNR